jgi:hypothetical protein
LIQRCAEHGVYPLAPAIPATVSPESRMKVLWRTWLQGFGLDDEARFLSRTWSAIGLLNLAPNLLVKMHPRTSLAEKTDHAGLWRAAEASGDERGRKWMRSPDLQHRTAGGCHGPTLLRRRDTTGFGLRSGVCLRSPHRRVARVRSATLNAPSAAARGLRGRLRGVLRVAPL